MATIILKQKKKKPKGRELENKIECVIDQINALTEHLAIRIEVRQVRTKTGLIYAKKQPFDYLICTKGLDFAFDAKECSDVVWYPSQAPDHQKKAMLKMQAMGNRAGFLVWFRLCGDLPGSIRFIEDFEEPATVDSGIPFGWDMVLERKRKEEAIAIRWRK